MLELTTFSLLGTTPVALTLLIGSIGLFLFLSHKWALPHPIPGIPYNEKAAKSLFGDLPDMISHIASTKELFSWVPRHNVTHNSPIVQLFCRPLGKPWVILTDYREAQDILLRRTREFDRSDFLGDVFLGMVPDHHISKRSTSEEFKRNRKLLQDLMTPRFLHQVAAPQIYSAIMTLVELWTEKCRLSSGRPFSATSDICEAALDAIWAATFGLDQEHSTTHRKVRFLQSTREVDLPGDVNQAVDYPPVLRQPAYEAIFTLAESTEMSIKSPFPRISYWLLSQLPYMRRAKAAKESMIAHEIDNAVQRLLHQSESEQITRSAMDDILRREILLARKQNREPVVNSRPIIDELFGFLIAGHDTTSTTVTWGLKLLADSQDSQTILRSDLRNAFADAAAEERQPTAEEIAKSQIPYLDAVLEEIVRKSLTTSGVIRNALVDTTILGHHIPKGTDVFLMGNGPDFHTPPIPVKEELRSESSRNAKLRVGSWDPEDMQIFRPERWLALDDDDKVVFDAMAGPHLVFGLGPRGCFGKRLAYLELRLIIVLLLWNFELQTVPGELNSYNAQDKMTRQAAQCYVKLAKA